MGKFTLRVLLTLLAVLAACRELPTGSADRVDPFFPTVKQGLGYTAIVPPLAPGYSALIPVDINMHHLAVGHMTPAGTTSSYSRQPAYWAAGSSAPPQLLPLGPYTPPGIPTDIADNGLIVGNVGRAAVLWRPVGSDWELVTLHADARVNGVAEDGHAAGAVYNPAYPTQENPQPVVWDAAGTLHPLPLPGSGGFNGGEAHAISAAGDVAGEVQVWTLGVWYSWGAVWIRGDDGSYGEPIVLQTGPSRGVSERTPTGTLHATAGSLSRAYRNALIRDAAGNWEKGDSTYIAGSAEDMNAAGDLVGTSPKGRFASTGVPFLATLAGTVTNLPIPKGTTGVATGISSDGWIAGRYDLTGVIWKR